MKEFPWSVGGGIEEGGIAKLFEADESGFVIMLSRLNNLIFSSPEDIFNE